MEQLTMGDIIRLYIELRDSKQFSVGDIEKLPIYLGNDDELNGIHCGWYVNLVDKDNEEDSDIVEMINEDYCNIKLTSKGILIS